MPTPALPLLHHLLQNIHIPIHPPTLASISPSLLLLTLESLLSYRLPLPKNIRLCTSKEDEISVMKCILGVLADDLLGMDLTLVDPRRVVEGKEREMEVVIMALVVVAKRKGIDLKPKEVDWLEEEEDEGLQEPLIPDISFSSIGSGNGDVFASSPTPASRSMRHEKVEGRDGSGSVSVSRDKKTVLDEILEEFGV
jgi:hypothetical protein